MDERLERLLQDVRLSRPPADTEALRAIASNAGVDLPLDYLETMRRSDGGRGDVGNRWLELWPVAHIAETASAPPRYEGVLLFAGDGANTVFGFDTAQDGAIVEGDWIGLNRDELILHGASFTEFLESLAASDPGADEP